MLTRATRRWKVDVDRRAWAEVNPTRMDGCAYQQAFLPIYYESRLQSGSYAAYMYICIRKCICPSSPRWPLQTLGDMRERKRRGSPPDPPLTSVDHSSS
jgi:hypothetical protein